jgi:hypothetical protein
MTKPLQQQTDFYRKFVGVAQLSSVPLHMSVCGQYLTLASSDDVVVPLATLTHKEFMEWTAEKILSIAGVELNDLPEIS